jgi:hypothetical protein
VKPAERSEGVVPAKRPAAEPAERSEGVVPAKRPAAEPAERSEGVVPAKRPAAEPAERSEGVVPAKRPAAEPAERSEGVVPAKRPDEQRRRELTSSARSRRDRSAEANYADDTTSRAEAREWWRRRELNPRPKVLLRGPLRAYPLF